MSYIDDDFLLGNDAAKELYHDHAARMPIIDYHNHLDPRLIFEDYRFGSIAEVWLGGDHYKWRALRANGVDERYVTGDADDWDKFLAWARTVPYTMRNPLYHWTHLELKRYFGVDELLNERSAAEIYAHCNELLSRPAYSVRNLLRMMKVERLCTTDDPVDTLEYHKRLRDEGFGIEVLPTWRPDKVMNIEGGTAYRDYIRQLSAAADTDIVSVDTLLEALRKRQAYFAEAGCRLSDHGVSEFPSGEFTGKGMEAAFGKALRGESVNAAEADLFKSGMLYHLAVMNHERGWTQQFHFGAIRNNSKRLFDRLGPDIGCDSIGDGSVAAQISRLFSRLDDEGRLAKTILYNLNPKDSEVLVSMAYNFNDGSQAGKMQYGAAWWFLDQMDGMVKQLNTLSSFGLLSRFVGMLTDSRSFLSYPRHEYFRRILCNLLGEDVEKGWLPASEMPFIGQMVEDICYCNAKRYF